MTIVLPDYWNSAQIVDITHYDLAFITKYPSATKQLSHESLAQDIRILRKQHKYNAEWRAKLKAAKKALKLCYRDRANVDLWGEKKHEFADIALQKMKEKEKQDLAAEKYLTALVEDKANSRKRTQDDRSETGSDGSANSSDYQKRRRQDTATILRAPDPLP